MIFAFHGNSGDGGVMVTTWDKHTEQGMVLIAPSALPTGPGLKRAGARSSGIIPTGRTSPLSTPAPDGAARTTWR